jgi:Fe-S-cluster containining protein
MRPAKKPAKAKKVEKGVLHVTLASPPRKVQARRAKSRCTGHCCRSFSIPFSPEALEREYRMTKDDPARGKDIDTIHGMVIYLGQFQTNPLLRIKGESWTEKALHIALKARENERTVEMSSGDRRALAPYSYERDQGQHWYACRHVQLNGDCGIYEDRPRMCRVYPNGSECAFADCTWDPKAQARHNKKLYPERHKLIPTERLARRRGKELRHADETVGTLG